MTESEPQAIDVDAVKQAGKLILCSLDQAELDVKRSPAFNQLVAASRETDPIARAAMKANAHKNGVREAHAQVARLQSDRDRHADGTEMRALTPDAQQELDKLKQTLHGKIRRRAEEEIARTYPEVESTKKRRAPRRHRIDV